MEKIPVEFLVIVLMGIALLIQILNMFGVLGPVSLHVVIGLLWLSIFLLNLLNHE